MRAGSGIEASPQESLLLVVLDNLEGAIQVWSDTPYLYLKRQSDEHTGRWVTVADTKQDLLLIERPEG